MTQEEYIVWRANQLYDQEVAKQADTDTTSFVNKQISSDEETKLAVKEAAYAGKTEDEIRALDSRALTKYYGSGNDADSLNISAIEGTSTFSSDSIKSDISGVVRDYASVTDRTYALNGSALAGIGLADIKVDDAGNVTVNGNAQTSGFDSEYIDDLDYYTNKVETRLNGDKNNTGYYFDYVYSKGGIYLVNKYDKQESDDDTPSSQKNCKVTYGAEVKGCYRYTGGTHDGYKYRSPSSGELDDGNGAACTGTGLSAAFRKKVYYSCN